jgi:hypothetical protein
MVDANSSNEKGKFYTWWCHTSKSIIRYLIIALATLCMGIVTYNFAMDAELQKKVAEIKDCKVEKTEYREDVKKTDDKLTEIRKEQIEGFREVRGGLRDINKLILQLHANDGN